MKFPKFVRSYEVLLDLPDPLEPLGRLVRNYYWAWDHKIRDLFRDIDRELWEKNERNPVGLINQLSPERLESLAGDANFLSRLQDCIEREQTYLAAHTWFDENYPGLRDKTTIAYFCAEFGISEGLPIYSGGLGVLAGDHLKAASDLGLPLVGIGLLYNRGYFRQRINFDGWQQEVYPQYDFSQMPLTLMRHDDGRAIRVEVEFPDHLVTCQIWRADVGRVKLYLLDSNVLENQPSDQGITDTLYGGDEEMRIRQEMILGIGGMRALKALGIEPTVCHMNEGHAAFLSIERIRQCMEANQCDFATAKQVVVNGNVFTTHTPVPAGFDLFPPAMLDRYLGKSIAALGIGMDEFLRLGRLDPFNSGEAFNMAILAMNTANYLNGVSQLHAEVTRTMFSQRWPAYPESEIPVSGVTNGIHTMTWVSRRMAALFDQHLGLQWRSEPQSPDAWANVDLIPDEDLWAVMENSRSDLIRFVRKRLQRDLERRTQIRPDFATMNSILDPRILTIGFARRFATYKRASLMISDRERFKQILFHPERPIQVVIAGKSHPRDDAGKKIIQDLIQFIERDGVRSRVVFLEDYDMRVARLLVQGVDVWLNNPRRPYEASGTSGMKVIPNGGLNCSILDGWWDEAYDKSVGWAIGDRSTQGDPGHQDWIESRELYHLLESEIAPLFYRRGLNGVPENWIKMVKASIKRLAPFFSTNRMVQEYAERGYLPASAAYDAIRVDGLRPAREAVEWNRNVRERWPKIAVRNAKDDAKLYGKRGEAIVVDATVALDGLRPDDVLVEVVVGRAGSQRDLLESRATQMTLVGQEGGDFAYRASVTNEGPGHFGYTIRIRPRHGSVSVDTELALMSWL